MSKLGAGLLSCLFAASAVASAAPPDPSLQNTYGTTQSSYYRMGASEFTPLDAVRDTYSDTGNGDGLASFLRYGTEGNSLFVGTPHLPAGARVLGVYVTGCAGSNDGLFGFIKSCAFAGSSCQNLAAYHGVQGCGNDFVDLASSNFVVDNGPFGPRFVIVLGTSDSEGSDAIAGATVEYVLQVSPAPASATFNDVPVSDSAFQYIEALVKSGVTAGTGNGNYSPDAFVTRRQMAVFIAKALGLHWR